MDWADEKARDVCGCGLFCRQGAHCAKATAIAALARECYEAARRDAERQCMDVERDADEEARRAQGRDVEKGIWHLGRWEASRELAQRIRTMTPTPPEGGSEDT